MTKMPDQDETAAAIFADVGRALFAHDADWQARYAKALGIQRDTIRQVQRPRSTFGPDDPLFDRLLELAERRADEITCARDKLRAWLSSHRK